MSGGNSFSGGGGNFQSSNNFSGGGGNFVSRGNFQGGRGSFSAPQPTNTVPTQRL